MTSINRLLDQPEMGIDVDELPGTQDLITGDYIVRYAVLEDEIYILRIWHGKEFGNVCVPMAPVGHQL